MTDKCPLCGGKVKDGYCVECGYQVLDDSQIHEMSSQYDTNPLELDDPVPKYKDPSIRIKPDIKVAQPKQEDKYPYNYQKPQQNAPVNNEKQYNFTPYQTNQPNQPDQNNYSPYQQYKTGNVQYNDTNNNHNNVYQANNSGDSKSYWGKNWWKILVAVMIPIVGFFLAVNEKKYSEPEAKTMSTILIIVSILRIVGWFAIW